MQDTNAVPTPLDTLIARLDAMARRYEARQLRQTATAHETAEDAQQEAHEIAEAVTVALQDGAL